MLYLNRLIQGAHRSRPFRATKKCPADAVRQQGGTPHKGEGVDKAATSGSSWLELTII